MNDDIRVLISRDGQKKIVCYKYMEECFHNEGFVTLQNSNTNLFYKFLNFKILKKIKNLFLLILRSKFYFKNPKHSKIVIFDCDLNTFIFVRADRKMIKIDFDSILYIESYSDYIKIHLDKQDTIITRETISAIEAKLPNNSFLRIHRSFIICLEKIQSFTNEHITINRKALPISRSYKKDVLKTLEKY